MSAPDLRQWAAAVMPSHATHFRVGARVRVVHCHAPAYPAAWAGLVGTVTAVLGEVPTYRVRLDGAEEHGARERAVFVRAELEVTT